MQSKIGNMKMERMIHRRFMAPSFVK